MRCELAQAARLGLPERVSIIRRFLLLPLLLLAGCATTERAAMSVGIADINFSGAEVNETGAVFALRITNEALFPLVVESDVHRIFLNGTFIGEGSSKETFALPRLGTVTRIVTVRPGDQAAAERLREVVAQGRAEFRIESRLTTIAFDQRTVFVNKSSGSFTLPGRRTGNRGRSQATPEASAIPR